MKPLEWIAGSKKDLKSMPDSVQDNVGFALFLAQLGEEHEVEKRHRETQARYRVGGAKAQSCS
jgi:phage-related protein